jgi:hypothetical protein
VQNYRSYGKKPIGVSEYKTGKLPKNIKDHLPSPEQFQHIIEISDKKPKGD